MKKLLPFLITIFVILAAVLLTDSICMTRSLTGFPCPGCGLTRANLSFFSGKISQAFDYHPLFLLVDIFILYSAAYSLILKKNETKAQRIAVITFFILIIAVYIYRMVTLYPKHEPMTYNYNSLFYRIKQILFIKFK